jgi:hypothetical protein
LITGQKRREVAIGPEVSAAPGPPADLLSIGPDSVVLMGAWFNGYRARAGVIEIGPVTLGANAFVGEQAVLDIHTTL